MQIRTDRKAGSCFELKVPRGVFDLKQGYGSAFLLGGHCFVYSVHTLNDIHAHEQTQLTHYTFLSMVANYSSDLQMAEIQQHCCNVTTKGEEDLMP